MDREEMLAALRLGLERHRAGDWARAEALYREVLAAQPDMPEVLNLLGTLACQTGRHALAIDLAERALALQPDYPEALNSRGNALREAGRPVEALASYDHALNLRPGYAVAWSNRGLALAALGRLEEAVASYDVALKIGDDGGVTHYNRANVLRSLGRHEEALAGYARASALGWDDPRVSYNRGHLCFDLGRFDEALAAYERALAIDPGYVAAWTNRGNTLQELGRHGEALQSYACALALEPDNPDALWNDALCRLATGDLAGGWAGYEARWRIGYGPGPRSFPQPLWLGEQDPAGRDVLVHAEQGFGDTLQGCRYLPLLVAKGARVIVEVPAALRRLMAAAPFAGQVRVLAHGEPLPAFDFHCPMMSLPLAFGTTLASIPAQVPYLVAPPALVSHWQDRLGTCGGIRVGLAWSGRPTHADDPSRSIALARLLDALALPGVSLVSLQKEVSAEDAGLLAERAVMAAGGDFADFADTAAVISMLDLVITVDTAVAHLAGALGKPAWILLASRPDWRWLLGRSDSPWYPQAMLFRQVRRGDWGPVLADVRERLLAVAGGHDDGWR